MPKDSGNYTCLVTSLTKDKDNVVQKHIKNLAVVAVPIYKITTHLMYKLSKICDLSDGDAVSNYLPGLLSGLLCGKKHKLCKVEVVRPKCSNKEHVHLMNVTFILTMHSLRDIVSNLDNNRCKVNCQVEMYSKLASVLVKNIEMFAKLPISIKVEGTQLHLEPKPMVSAKEKTAELTSRPPLLVITCPSGFGVEKTGPKICGK